jgi:ABC-type transport system substrate-binding protein
VPEATVPPEFRKDYVNWLMQHPGYQPKWGTPKYGGVVKLSGPATVTSFHVGTTGYSAFINLSFASHNSILMIDPWLDMEVGGVRCDLCETFELSADGTKYTFKLRDDVQFQSEGWGKDKGAPGFGAEMVCKDVKASMEWIANPHSSATPAVKAQGKRLLGHLKEVTCPDGPQGKTVVMQFNYFRNMTLESLAVGSPVWNKEYQEWRDEKYPGIQYTAKEEGYLINMGTGPQIPTFANGEVVLKTRTSPNYWVKGAPFVDGYEFYPILDYNTKFTAWITGKTDHAGHGSSGITKAQVVQARQKYPNHTIHVVGYNHISQIMMNPLRPPLDSWKVRYAIHLAMDRGAWIQFNKAGDLDMSTNTYYFHASSPWAIPYEEYKNDPGYRRDKKDADIAEANRLLDEVFGKGIRPKDTDLMIWTLLSRREIGVWMIDQFREKLGWELPSRFVEQSEYGKKISDSTYILTTNAAPMHGMCCTTDPSTAFQPTNSKAGIFSDAFIRGWKGQDQGKDLQTELDRVDALIDELDTSLDRARRRELSNYLQRYMVEERTTGVFLGGMNTAWGTGPRLKGTYFNHLASYSQVRLYDRWWISE